MDHPLINESTFSSANPSAYTLAEIWSLAGEHSSGGLGLRMGSLGHNLVGLAESSMHRDGSAEESTVMEQSGGGGELLLVPIEGKGKMGLSLDLSSRRRRLRMQNEI